LIERKDAWEGRKLKGGDNRGDRGSGVMTRMKMSPEEVGEGNLRLVAAESESAFKRRGEAEYTLGNCRCD